VMRLLDVAAFTRQEISGAIALGQGCHGTETSQTDAAHRHDVAGNRRSSDA
jgi:hypothetical protein